MAAKPFADGLVATGEALGIDQFLLVQWLAPLSSEAPELIVATIFAWRLHAAEGLGMLLSAKVNQWTLLVGSLWVAYTLGGGGGAPLPLDDRQTEEFLLTSAQALLAFAVLADLRFGLWEAAAIFGLFILQFPFPNDRGPARLLGDLHGRRDRPPRAEARLPARHLREHRPLGATVVGPACRGGRRGGLSAATHVDVPEPCHPPKALRMKSVQKPSASPPRRGTRPALDRHGVGCNRVSGSCRARHSHFGLPCNTENGPGAYRAPRPPQAIAPPRARDTAVASGAAGPTLRRRCTPP